MTFSQPPHFENKSWRPSQIYINGKSLDASWDHQRWCSGNVTMADAILKKNPLYLIKIRRNFRCLNLDIHIRSHGGNYSGCENIDPAQITWISLIFSLSLFRRLLNSGQTSASSFVRLLKVILLLNKRENDRLNQRISCTRHGSIKIGTVRGWKGISFWNSRTDSSN